MHTETKLFLHRDSMLAEGSTVATITLIDSEHGPWMKTEVKNREAWENLLQNYFTIDFNTYGYGNTPEERLLNLLFIPDNVPRTEAQKDLFDLTGVNGWWIEAISLLAEGNGKTVTFILYHGDSRDPDFGQVNIELNLPANYTAVLETTIAKDSPSAK